MCIQHLRFTVPCLRTVIPLTIEHSFRCTDTEPVCMYRTPYGYSPTGGLYGVHMYAATVSYMEYNCRHFLVMFPKKTFSYTLFSEY